MWFDSSTGISDEEIDKGLSLLSQRLENESSCIKKAYLEECYRKGAEQAERIAQRTIDKMYKKVGFVAR